MANEQHSSIKPLRHEARSQPPNVPSNHGLRTHCYLCGLSKSSLEIEHVVPKILFRGYNPGRYVRLWACRKCNKAKGLDDEYVTRYLQASSFAEPAKTGFKHAIRGFSRGGSGQGLGTDMRSKLTRVEALTPAGVHLGNVPALKLDTQRFEAFLANIAKGLWVSYSLCLPDWQDYQIDVWFEQAIQSQKIFHDPLLKSLRQEARFGEYWENIFTYSGDFNENSSMWFLLFYSSYAVVVIFTPRAEDDPELD